MLKLPKYTYASYNKDAEVQKLANSAAGYLAVIFRPNPLMMLAGTTAPCAGCRLTAINNVNEEKNRGYTEKLFKFMNEKFGIPGDRMYTLFLSATKDHVGYSGRLFSDV